MLLKTAAAVRDVVGELAQLKEPLPATMGLSQTYWEGATHGSNNDCSLASVCEDFPGIYPSVSHAGGVEASPSCAEGGKTQVPLGDSTAGDGVGLDDLELRRIASGAFRVGQSVLRGVSIEAEKAGKDRCGLSKCLGPFVAAGVTRGRRGSASRYCRLVADGGRWLHSAGLRWFPADVSARGGTGKISLRRQSEGIGADDLDHRRGASAFGRAVVLALG